MLLGLPVDRRGSDVGQLNLPGALAKLVKPTCGLVLVCGPKAPETPVPKRQVARSGPGALARALDAEGQIRPIDALVPAGRRERMLLGLSPRALRGAVPPLRPADPADGAVSSLQNRVRSN